MLACGRLFESQPEGWRMKTRIVENPFWFNEPPPFGRCPSCRKWFAFKSLREEPGQFGPTRIYSCRSCGHEAKYETLMPTSPDVLR
jgi:hypothetical protein